MHGDPVEAGAWGMVECLQDPGTLMYVPHNWYHATINEGEVVSVAHNANAAASGRRPGRRRGKGGAAH